MSSNTRKSALDQDQVLLREVLGGAVLHVAVGFRLPSLMLTHF